MQKLAGKSPKASGNRARIATGASPMAGKRGQRGSRNKKKNMRTKIDLSDVDAEMEEKWHEERTGGPVSAKVDAQLFSLDTSVAAPEPHILSRKARAAAKPIQLLVNLQPKSAVKPISAQAERKLHIADVSLKTVPPAVAPRAPAPADPPGAAVVAAWDGTAPAPKRAADWMPEAPPPPKRHCLRGYRPEPSIAAPVAIPVGGLSYHPADTAHQALLDAALEAEKTRLAKLDAVHKRLPVDLSIAARAQLWHNEAADGIESFLGKAGAEESESEGDEDGEEGEGALALRPVVRAENRKSKQQRRTEARLQQELESRTALKRERLRANDLIHAKRLKKEIAAAERAHKVLVLQRTAARQERALRVPRTLGNMKFKEPEPVLKLSDELPGSLRQLRPEGNLLRERIASLQKRNIIEPRLPTQQRRKYARKEYEKRSYKNFDEQQQREAAEKNRVAVIAAKKKAKVAF